MAQNGHANGVNTKPEVIDTIKISVDENAAKSDSCDSKNQNGGHKAQNGAFDASKDLLGVPRREHRKSFMEEESARERLRLSMLKQCSAILKQGEGKYTKETLHRTFQDEVSFCFYFLKVSILLMELSD
jgi:hypothetical protein